MGLELLRAFYDESGIHGDAKFCALTGFIARPSEWERFDPAWRVALAEAGLKSFRAVDFFPRRRKPLSPRRRVCLAGLLQAASENNLVPSGAIVNTHEFQSMAYLERCYLSGALVGADDTDNLEKLAKPYYLAFHHCLAHAASIAKPGEKVEFVFAQQWEFRDQAFKVFWKVASDLPPEVRARIGGCMFKEMEDIGPPLEVADLLAHCWFAHMQYGAAENSVDREHALDRLMVEPGWLHRYGKADFEMLMDRGLSPDQRALLRGEVTSGI